MKIIVCGLSISSSWGNGHATTFRALLKALARLGHEIIFLERDMPWYAENRDLKSLPYAKLEFYHSVEELEDCFGNTMRDADIVVMGSYVPEGISVAKCILRNANGVRVFYDIDTPVTVRAISERSCEYIDAALIPQFDLYLSFTGGPMLQQLESEFRARLARPLYCAVDLDDYYPEPQIKRWDLGYLGTYSRDRQNSLRNLLVEPAKLLPERSFVVAGPQYPVEEPWAKNIKRIAHLPPQEHRVFYGQMRFTLNLTRADMVQAGFSPSIRLFEAAATGTPIISDFWEGLDTFFKIGQEILVAASADTVVRYLRELPESVRQNIGERARNRIERNHSAHKRALEFLRFVDEAKEEKAKRSFFSEVQSLGPWFHNFHLDYGLETAPGHALGDFPLRKWQEIAPHLPEDLRGWRCLDIGCNAGFYSFELAKRGASVLGIDADPLYLRQARWLAQQMPSQQRPEFAEMQIHELADLDETFDLVLFLGVFYHLRYPMLALDTVSRLVSKLMIFQTLTMDPVESDQTNFQPTIAETNFDYPLMEREPINSAGWPKLAFIEKSFAGDPTNWFLPNHAAIEALLRSTGFARLERIGHEIYLCFPPIGGVSDRRNWDEAEWRSATGIRSRNDRSYKDLERA